MIKGYYICKCGKEFTNPQSFNGHKAHCDIFQLAKYGSLDKKNINIEKKKKNVKYYSQLSHKFYQQKNQNDLHEWLESNPKCECCGKIMTKKYGSGRFCSISCANTRHCSDQVKEKISNSIKNISRKNPYIENYKNNPNYCTICGSVLDYNNRYRKTCSSECLKKLQQLCGLQSCNIQADNRRSKNEIYFYELCCKNFSNVDCNKQLFNGWDADIILLDEKIAILWNGIWHYKKIREKQSLEQIQSRDKIKIDNILSCGYTPYVIKDMGKYDKKFVEEQFEKFVKWLNDKK